MRHRGYSCLLLSFASEADCLACGGTGTVLRAITGSRYQPQPCPVCEPVQKAG
jgi:hypothetical protein